MGVQLNIKSARARELAEQVAARTGESLTKAVETALEERLKKVGRLSDEELVEKWLKIGADLRAKYPDFPSSEEIDAEFYDEDGLPR